MLMIWMTLRRFTVISLLTTQERQSSVVPRKSAYTSAQPPIVCDIPQYQF